MALALGVVVGGILLLLLSWRDPLLLLLLLLVLRGLLCLLSLCMPGGECRLW